MQADFPPMSWADIFPPRSIKHDLSLFFSIPATPSPTISHLSSHIQFFLGKVPKRIKIKQQQLKSRQQTAPSFLYQNPIQDSGRRLFHKTSPASSNRNIFV